MRLNVHAGHGKQDSKSCGAYTNLLKESVENRDINNDLIAILRKEGHTVHDCTVNYPASQSDCINQIVKKCNSNTVDLDISIHFNAGRNNIAGDGKIGGVECICYDNKGTSKAYAERICKELSDLGFTNRGVKYSKNLGYLANTKAQAIVVEVCFVDDKDDVELYKKVKSSIGKSIAQGILNKKIVPSNSSTTNKFEHGKSYEGRKATVMADSLNVRYDRGTSNKIIGKLSKGQTVNLGYCLNNWVSITGFKGNKGMGYVHVDYLKLL